MPLLRQLQYCFHHNGADVPGPEERENIKNIIKQEIAIDTSNDYDLRWSIFIEDAIVIEDLFNIDLKGLCKQLNIVYNERIGIEYKKFLDYANDII